MLRSNEAEVGQGFGKNLVKVAMPTDLYLLLGLEREASPQQIQAAYAHWARQLQPDPDAAASAPIRDLEDAYAVLAHPERRRAYDSREQLPAAVERPKAEPLRAPQRQPLMAREDISLRESFGECHPSFAELFDRLWSNFERVSRPKTDRLESLTLEVPLTGEQAAAGGLATVLVPARAQCPACLGHGALGMYQCWHCEGQGSITGDYPVRVGYPAGIKGEHVVQVPLDHFGIRNFFLTVRFRT
jgi:molecular chaperone DnaJ